MAIHVDSDFVGVNVGALKSKKRKRKLKWQEVQQLIGGNTQDGYMLLEET